MRRKFASFAHRSKERSLYNLSQNRQVCSHLVCSKGLKSNCWGHLSQIATQVEKILATYETTTRENQTL